MLSAPEQDVQVANEAFTEREHGRLLAGGATSAELGGCQPVERDGEWAFHKKEPEANKPEPQRALCL